MKELIKFFSRNSFLLLFLLLEGFSLILVVQNNSFQKSYFVNSARNITGYFYKNLQGYKEYFKLREMNQVLTTENARLRNEITALSQREAFPEGFLSDSVNGKKFSYLPVRVVNNSVNLQYNYMTLSAGSNQGLKVDMAVISEEGVAGIITAVSRRYALVLPVINRNFRLSAKIERNNYFGIIEWEGLNRKLVTLREIPVHAEVVTGDKIVTSGHSAIFPEGIPVGKVISFREGDGNFYEITVELATDFANLYHVNVINNSQREEQLSLEMKSGL